MGLEPGKPADVPRLGTVVIGRNEGERLIRCLKSLNGAGLVVYVDSQSTDGSAAAAAALGANVVGLDMRLPFTAARARNAGFARLMSVLPEADYVQFVDGDCEVIAGWIETAVTFLSAHPDVAGVCGRRMERFPEASIYNAMCHREWNTPVGMTDAFGGDSILRVAAFKDAGGFLDEQIAHEEPELCGRLRKKGWKLWRLDAGMTLHDAAILRFGQFYKRGRRAGMGLAQLFFRSGWDMDRGGRTIVIRAVVWAMILPLAVIVAFLVNPVLGLAALAIYPLQVIRHALTNRLGVGTGLPQRLRAAAITMVGKFAEAQGVIEFFLKRLTRKKVTSVSYK